MYNNKKKMVKVTKTTSKEMPKKKEKQLELLYMSPVCLSVEQMQQAMKIVGGKEEIHIWPELDIMEFVLSDETTVDVETMTDYINDEEDKKFLEEQQIISVYAVTLLESTMESFLPYVKALIKEFGGFLCTDSDDFTPYLCGQENIKQ